MGLIRNLWPVMATAVAMGLLGCDGEEDTDPYPMGPPESVQLFRFEQFKSVTPVDGGEVTLESLAGKVVMLDLFGTWCPSCRRSTPVVVSLYERYREQGFEIIGLAYEQTADEAQAKRAVGAYREAYHVPYVLALGPPTLWDELRQHANVSAVVPTVLLLDRQGIVRYVFEGMPPGREAVVADRVERLLAEPYVPIPGRG